MSFEVKSREKSLKKTTKRAGILFIAFWTVIYSHPRFGILSLVWKDTYAYAIWRDSFFILFIFIIAIILFFITKNPNTTKDLKYWTVVLRSFILIFSNFFSLSKIQRFTKWNQRKIKSFKQQYTLILEFNEATKDFNANESEILNCSPSSPKSSKIEFKIKRANYKQKSIKRQL